MSKAQFTLGSFGFRTLPGLVYDPAHSGLAVWLDLNGDRYDDRIVTGAFYPGGSADWVSRPGWLAWGTPEGFRPAVTGEFPSATMRSVHAREFALADFNGDGRSDLFIADHGYDAGNFPGYQNRLYLSAASGAWTDATAALPQQFDFTHSVATSDIDRDGDIDILVGNFQYKDVYMLRGDGRGAFERTVAILPTQPGQVMDATRGGLTSTLLHDLDNDGFPEMVLGRFADPANQQPPSTIVWSRSGSYAEGEQTLLPLPANFGGVQGVMDVQATDVNLDGRPDLLVAYQRHVWEGGWELQVLINRSNRQFEDQTRIWLPDAAAITGGIPATGGGSTPWIEFLRPLDVNQDGRLDFVVDGNWFNPDRPTDNFPVFLIQQQDGRYASITSGDLRSAGVPAFMFWSLEYAQRGPTGPGELVQQYYGSGGVPTVNSVPIQFAPVTARWSGGSAAPERLSGTPGSDWLGGFGGNDTLEGGGGIDLAYYNARRSEASLARTADGWSVVTLNEGIDSLLGVERLRFADGHLALDLHGHAGITAKVIGALFGKAWVANATYVGVGLSLLDAGMSHEQLVAMAISTEAFAQLAGGRSNAQFVDLVYRNLVGQAPGAEERDYFVGLLDRGEASQASLGWMASETAANALQIDLAGLALAGLPYLPFGD